MIDNYLAPEIISNQGRIFILMIWAMLIAASLFGVTKLEQNFSMEFFLPPGDPLTDYIELNAIYFK